MAILTFAEDFTSTVDLDSELLGTPDSGLYWNRGVHPLVTVNNLLEYLPVVEFTFTAWSGTVTYTKFDTSRKKSDIVSFNNKVYQSLVDSNINNSPDVSTTEWLETTIDSLRIKSFLWTVDDNFLSALKLNRQLIENQYIYNKGENFTTLANDFSGWAFEPKGSDYIKIRINQMSITANTTDTVDVSVINQGEIIDTITLNPDNGKLVFEDVGTEYFGKGRFLFVFSSQEVLSDAPYNDPLRYDGFVCYPVNGIGATAVSSDYSETANGNGLSFNVSAYLDSSLYITNNKIDLAKFLQTQFEYDFLRMAVYNSNVQANRTERVLEGANIKPLLNTEVLDLNMDTIARKYNMQKKRAIESINKTFDKFLHAKKGFRVKRRVL